MKSSKITDADRNLFWIYALLLMIVFLALLAWVLGAVL